MIAALGELAIQHRLGLEVYRRAQVYHQAGAIQGATREGRTLRARCKGTAPEPYRVWATLDERGVVVANCSCPVGAAGRCKHVGALLLAWKDHPEQFQDHWGVALDPLGSHAHAPALRELADAYPELASLMAPRSLVVQSNQNPTEVFQAACRELMGHGPTSYEVLRRLIAVRAAAERALLEQHLERAAWVYEGLLQALLERPGELVEGGLLAGLSISCVQGLGRCLRAEGTIRGRSERIKALFLAFRSGADGGGLPLGTTAGEILHRLLREEERAQVCRWLEAAMATAQEGVRQIYGGLWTQLETGRATEEWLLAIARRSGRIVDVIDRLLRMGRTDEACAEARRVAPEEAVAASRCFQAHGQSAAAIAVLEAVPADKRPVEVLDELAKRLEAHGDLRRAMTWAMEALRLAPTITRYREVKRLGQKGNQWASLKLAIEAWLLGAQEEAMLASVYLEEGFLVEAISLAERSRNLEVKEAVAKVCEGQFPKEALNLYRQVVEMLVAERGPEGYLQARGKLQAMRRLHKQVGEGPSWTKVSARFRGKFPLRKAG
ncbi:MAG: hypothetical protein RMJ98_16300 [Myxococcales bacterium]|nr:hypothetical protein [Polyangiaceae bacterium]MDW8250856.1 hypothetical protein [Myxococcales bacterium]